MKKRHKDLAIELGELRAYAMCKRKRKFKSSEAGKLAGKIGQRKYECPICGHWHLTKSGGKRNEPSAETQHGKGNQEKGESIDGNSQ